MKNSDLAEKLGVHNVTVSRLITGRIQLTQEWLDRLGEALNTSPESILFDTKPLRTVHVRAYVEAGVWAESNEWDEEEWYDVAVPNDPDLANYKLYGAEARGPSMNKRYPEGTVLIFTDAIETEEEIKVGSRYIVERERADGLRECTIKTLIRDETGKYWLMPESSDPRHQQPIEIDGDNGDTVRMMGRVRYSVQRED